MRVVCLVITLLSAQIIAKYSISDDLTESTRDDTFGLLLQEIMIRTLHPYKCIMILTDELYYDIFEKRWFKRFGTAISYILVKVQYSDDLYDPDPEIQSSLQAAKYGDCQLYIFLLSNGIQMRRLLRFGDRYRALSTISKFILLYDNRLFEQNILYLWKRIINVIFIKKHQSIAPNNDLASEKDYSWFEITTVPFPVPIVNILVPRRLDIWAKSKFRKGIDLFKDKTIDLHNQTLKVAIFPHIPGVEKINITQSKTLRSIKNKTDSNETTYFAGVEIEILHTISTWMNFECDIYEPDNINEELWGRKLVGGVYTGIIGEIVSTKADIALGDLYYTPYLLNLMDLSVPYNTECLTFITPESLSDNTWKTLLLPFTPIMWGGVIILLIICTITFHYLALFHTKSTKNEINSDTKFKYKSSKKVITLSLHPALEKIDPNAKYILMKEKYQVIKKEGEPVGLYQFSEPINSVLYTYSMLLLVSLPKLPSGWSLRVLTGWYWLYCLLVVTAYRASLTAILARPVPKVKIDTVQELVNSKLTYGGWGEINREFFSTSTDPTINLIANNFVMVNDSESAIDKVAEASFAFYENTDFLREGLVKRQQRYKSQFNNTNSTQQTQYTQDRTLHIMEDCIIKMPVSIGLQKNSPLKPRMDKYIRRVLEAGFIKKWLDDVMQKIRNTEMQIEDTGSTKAIMNISKFSGALVALLCGYFISSLTLVGELLYYNLITKKDPNFNKYSKQVISTYNKSN